MNIIISQKDADFILAYLRTDLEKVTKTCDNLAERSEKFKTELEKHKGKMGIMEEIMSKGLLDVSSEMLKDSIQTKKKSELLKCIEILTVGSEGVNGAA